MAKKEPPVVEIRDNPFHMWARVELWKWQYGELPQDDDERELDVAAGMKKMAEALSDTNSNNMPTPFQVQQVLNYAADMLDGTEEIPGRTPTQAELLRGIQTTCARIQEEREAFREKHGRYPDEYILDNGTRVRVEAGESLDELIRTGQVMVCEIKLPGRSANDPDDPLPFDKLSEKEGEERCELCVHRRCEGGAVRMVFHLGLDRTAMTLSGIEYLSEQDFIETCEREGITEDVLMDRMIAEGWTIGRDEDGRNEWWLVRSENG